MEILLGLGCALVAVTVVGHGLWVLAASILKALSGSVDGTAGSSGSSSARQCANCGYPVLGFGAQCQHCGFKPGQARPLAPKLQAPVPEATGPAADAYRQDLQATLRHLQRLLARGFLPQEGFNILTTEIRRDLARFDQTQQVPTETPLVAIPEAVEAELIPTLQPIAKPSARPTQRPVTKPVVQPPIQPTEKPKFTPVPEPRTQAAILHSMAQPANPAASAGSSVPVRQIPNSPPSLPSRTLADTLQSFMEESNIRWGEVIAGLLIVVSAIGLVISLRSTLEKIRYFPALLFMGFTLAFFGAGMYTLKRWNLQAISRVILIIALLLVPLSFSAAILLAKADAATATQTDWVFFAAIVVGSAVFGYVALTSSRELVGEAKWRLTAGVMGTSLAQVLINRLVQPDLNPWQILGLGGLPAGAFLVAGGGEIFRATLWKHFSANRCQQIFLVLGIATFAVIAPLALLVHHAGAGYRWTTLAGLSPLLSPMGAVVLGLGLLVHRRTSQAKLARYRAAGTGIAVFGGTLMVLTLALAWPQPGLLIAVGILNACLLTMFALRGNLPVLHVAAIASAALACWLGTHWVQPHFQFSPATSRDLLDCLLMGRSSLILSLFAALVVGGGYVWESKGRRSDSKYYYLSAGGLGVVALAITLLSGFFPAAWLKTGLTLDRDLATPLLAGYALASCFAGRKTLKAELTIFGSLLFWVALIHAFLFNVWLEEKLALRSLSWHEALLFATLLHSGISLITAILLTRTRLWETGEGYTAWLKSSTWTSLVEPLVQMAIVSVVVATPLIVWVERQGLAIQAGYALFAALCWLAVLLTKRLPIALVGLQLMVAGSLALLVANYCLPELSARHAIWAEVTSEGHWQAQLMAIAAGAIAWSLGRKLAGRWRLGVKLFTSEFPTVDQVLLGLAVCLFPLLGIKDAIPGVRVELGYRDDLASFLIADPAAWSVPGGIWLPLLLVVAALLVSLAEKPLWATVGGLALALFATVWLVAAKFESQQTVASAVRWFCAIYALGGGALFLFRLPILWKLRQYTGLRLKSLQGETLWVFRLLPFVLGGIPVFLLTWLAVQQFSSGATLGGPAAESLWGRIGPTALYSGPLLVLVVLSLLYALVEKNTWFAALGAGLFQFSVNLGLILWSGPGTAWTSSLFAIEALQWNALGFGIYGLVWSLLSQPLQRQEPARQELDVTQFFSRDLQAILTCLAIFSGAAIIVWGAVAIVADPRTNSAEIAPLGGVLSYAAIAVALVLGGLTYRQFASLTTADGKPAESFLGLEIKTSLPDLLFVFTAALAVLVAMSCQTWAGGKLWVAYHVLGAAWLGLTLLGAIWSAYGKWKLASSRQLIPHFALVTLLGGGLTFLAIRGNAGDVEGPWWSLIEICGVLLAAIFLGCTRRSQILAYASVALAGLAVVLYWHAGTKVPLTALLLGGSDWPSTLCYCLCMATLAVASIWLWFEVRSQQARQESFDPRVWILPVHHLVSWLALLALTGATGLHTAGLSIYTAISGNAWPWDMVDLLGLMAWGTLLAVLVAALWDRRAVYVFPCLYVSGLMLMVWVMDQMRLPMDQLVFALGMGTSLYLAFTGQLWSFGANLAVLGNRAKIPEPVAGLGRLAFWLPGLTLVLATIVCVVELPCVWAHQELAFRVTMALAPLAAAWGVACLAQGTRREIWQMLSLLMGGVSVLYLAWARQEPSSETGMILQRAFAGLMVLSILTLAYGLLLPRFLFLQGDWNSATRRAGFITGALAVASFVLLLGLEVALFEPGIGVPAADAQVAAVAIVLVGLIAGLISLALLPGKDPLNLDEQGRQWYVYGAQATALLLFAHLYICRPFWFDGLLRPYWPFVTMAIAFAGVGLSELFARQKLTVLAVPFRRTGTFLPLLPVLAMWVAWPDGDRPLVLLTVAVLYLLLSMLHGRWHTMVAAVVAGNAALWTLLQRESFDLPNHPQLWLIPPALSALVAAQLNRRRLDVKSLTAIRYASTILIYLSSTSQIFISGLGKDIWPTIILLGLSLAGMGLGVVLRIRAFLYLGAGFVLLGLLSMVAHAARAIDQTWPWWVFGIGTGIALLALFAVFEKKRDDIKRLISWLREWEH